MSQIDSPKGVPSEGGKDKASCSGVSNQHSDLTGENIHEMNRAAWIGFLLLTNSLTNLHHPECINLKSCLPYYPG